MSEQGPVQISVDHVERWLAGWGNCPVQRCHVYRPDSPDELLQLLTSKAETSYIARGLGRSYGDASLNEHSGVVLHERLARFLCFDPQTHTLECEAGVTFAEIIEIFLPRGYFLSVTPGTKHVTVGGAIAADVHGKNHHCEGSMAESIIDFNLLTAAGDVLTCSREENADVFWATIGGMGLTGIILSAQLRLRPVESAYLTVDYQRAINLDDALEQISQADDSYTYSVAWIDGLATGGSLGRSVLLRGNHTPVDALPERARAQPRSAPLKGKITVPFFAPSFLLNSLSVRALNRLYYRKHRNATRVVDYDTFFYPLDAVLHWNRLYGKRGFVQYQVAFPFKTSRAGLVELLERLVQSRRSSFLTVLKRFGPANEGLLSFPFSGHTLALDLPNTGRDLVEFLGELDRIVLKHEGRVYLAKDAFLTPDAFAAMYPNLPRFKEIKQRIDPEQRFVSSLARRVGIVEVT